jgi:hypothetical protein
MDRDAFLKNYPGFIACNIHRNEFINMKKIT